MLFIIDVTLYCCMHNDKIKFFDAFKSLIRAKSIEDMLQILLNSVVVQCALR